MKQIKLKDTVWIAMGEHKLVPGRVVNIFTLNHLNEAGYIPDKEFYTIEISTSIDYIYEVREWETLSLDARGPLNAYRKINIPETNRYLKHIGPTIPVPVRDLLADDEEHDEPSQSEILAALEGKQAAPKKRRHYPRKKK